MDLDAVAGIEPVVDEAVVEAAWDEYLATGSLRAVDSTLNERGNQKRWQITSLGAADWAMRKLTDIREREQAYKDEIARWQQAAFRIGMLATWFEDRLKEWALSERTQDRKSFPLAHGTVGTRKSQPKVVVVDEQAALGWAEKNCSDAVKTVKSFLVSRADVSIVPYVVAFKATNSDDGERVRLDVDPFPWDVEAEQIVRKRLEPYVQVEPIVEPWVVDFEGKRVPGLEVEPERVTATVTPLGL